MGYKEDVDFGYVGECAVQLELARMGVRMQRMPEMGFDYDFVTSTGKRVEVKSSHLTKRKDGSEEWHFLNGRSTKVRRGTEGLFVGKKVRRNRQVDFYVLVGFEDHFEGDKYPSAHYWIIPASEVGEITNLSVFPGRANKWSSWAGYWTPLLPKSIS